MRSTKTRGKVRLVKKRAWSLNQKGVVLKQEGVA